MQTQQLLKYLVLGFFALVLVIGGGIAIAGKISHRNANINQAGGPVGTIDTTTTPTTPAASNDCLSKVGYWLSAMVNVEANYLSGQLTTSDPVDVTSKLGDLKGNLSLLVSSQGIQVDACQSEMRVKSVWDRLGKLYGEVFVKSGFTYTIFPKSSPTTVAVSPGDYATLKGKIIDVGADKIDHINPKPWLERAGDGTNSQIESSGKATDQSGWKPEQQKQEATNPNDTRKYGQGDRIVSDDFVMIPEFCDGRDGDTPQYRVTQDGNGNYYFPSGDFAIQFKHNGQWADIGASRNSVDGLQTLLGSQAPEPLSCFANQDSYDIYQSDRVGSGFIQISWSDGTVVEVHRDNKHLYLEEVK